MSLQPSHRHAGGHISTELRINDRIRVPEVRLVGPNGETVGIVPTDQALKLAQEADLDLVEIAPQGNTALEGLYMSRTMYCTQCEAQGFRKITFYPDRPDVMATFRVRIEGDAPVLLSNGNLVASGPGWAEWEDSWQRFVTRSIGWYRDGQ